MTRCPDCAGVGRLTALVFSFCCPPVIATASCARCAGSDEIAGIDPSAAGRRVDREAKNG